jgi:hypothetical protein
MNPKKDVKKNINKAVEYPQIYTYIYERESEDISRLAKSYKSSKKTNSETTTPKKITGFKIVNEKAIPVYSDLVVEKVIKPRQKRISKKSISQS